MGRRGITLEMAHHPQVILDTMAEMEGAVDRAVARQKVFRATAAVVVGLAIAGFVLGILLQEQTDGNSGCVAFLSLPLLFVGLVLLAVTGQRRSPLLREHFDATRQILHTLRDDTGRKGRVVGWLDLSGPQQKQKIVRTARSGGGKRKVYYRDPWFRAKFKLADGNLLRLTLEDKVKVKAGSIVRHESQFSAKLVVNPDLYYLGGAAASEIPHHQTAGEAGPGDFGAEREDGVLVLRSSGSAKDLSADFHDDGILVLKGSGSAKTFSARWVLETCKFAYSQLLDAEDPQSFYERLRAMAEEARQTREARQQRATRKAQQRLANFTEGLEGRGFRVSPRSDRLYYHPQIPDARFALAKRVIRLERKNQRRKRWELERSFSLARETDLALEAADAMLAFLEISG